jgi:hypothetical protein
MPMIKTDAIPTASVNRGGLNMFLPSVHRGLLLGVVVSVVLVFIAAFLANQVAFRQRFGNALVKTILHTLFFAAVALAWLYYRQTAAPPVIGFITSRLVDIVIPTAFSALIVFCVMLVGKLITFSGRLMNAVATTIVFALAYAAVLYGIRSPAVPGNLVDLVFL